MTNAITDDNVRELGLTYRIADVFVRDMTEATPDGRRNMDAFLGKVEQDIRKAADLCST